MTVVINFEGGPHGPSSAEIEVVPEGMKWMLKNLTLTPWEAAEEKAEAIRTGIYEAMSLPEADQAWLDGAETTLDDLMAGKRAAHELNLRDPLPELGPVEYEREAGEAWDRAQELHERWLPLSLADFNAIQLPEPIYVIPGVLEELERLILTGREGEGKSTLLRQVAVQVSAGLHPFTGERYKPVCTLLVDLENSLRQARDDSVGGTRRLAQLLPEGAVSQLSIVCRPRGLDLLDEEDQRLVLAWLERVRPNLIVIGPHYKLLGDDPNGEEPARIVAKIIDRWREQFKLAWIMEAHSPHGSTDGEITRPYGASLWRRWPEHGYHLRADGRLRAWRGDRGDARMPSWLRRDEGAEGQRWPWVLSEGRPVTELSEAALRRKRILQECAEERTTAQLLSTIVGAGCTETERKKMVRYLDELVTEGKLDRVRRGVYQTIRLEGRMGT